ncbi:DUF2773 domain-containing protein [Shigella flexneri]
MNGGVHCCKSQRSFTPTGLRNAHTRVVVNASTQPQDWSLATRYPQLAADVKTAWLNRYSSLLLFVEQPNFSVT